MVQWMRVQRGGLLIASLALGLAACGDDDGGGDAADTGVTDAGMTDTGVSDTGMTDTGVTDTGGSDTGGDVAEDATDAGADVIEDAADVGVDATDTGLDATDGGTDAADGGADSGADSGDAGPSFDLEGVWVDGFGGTHWITDDRWQSGWGPSAFVFATIEWDLDAMWLVAENDAANAFNPGLFSRFEWTIDGEGQLYYCQSVFDGASADEARDAERADAEDLDAGCGGFGWSTLTAGQGDLAIAGVWTDGFGTHTIDDAWTQDYGDGSPLIFVFDAYSNVDRWAVAQNDSDNAFNPDLFSRFEWTWTDEGTLAFCQSVFDAATADEARDAERANAGDLDAGCAGFAWSTLDPVED